MAHQRICHTQAGSTGPACLAVRAGSRVFLAGQTGLALDGSFTGLGDPAAQAGQAMRNVGALLAQAGAQVADIRKITTYVTDRAWLEPVAAVIGRHLGALGPPATELIVSGLAAPEMLVASDVEATAPLPPDRPASDAVDLL